MIVKQDKQRLSALWNFIKNSFSALFDALFPKCCLVCNGPGEYLCAQHKRNLLAYVPCCYVCDRPTAHGEVCFDDQNSPCKWVVVGFYYTHIIKEMIHAIKYANAFEMLDFFVPSLGCAILATTPLSQIAKSETTIITYVPMHWRKEKHQRWYNQAQLLAEKLAFHLGIPCIQLCQKHTNTQKQSSLGKEARKGNTQNVFQWNEKASVQIFWEKKLTILLVDDVLTTGATIDACAKTIKKHLPEANIWGVCIARNNG